MSRVEVAGGNFLQFIVIRKKFIKIIFVFCAVFRVIKLILYELI